MVWSTIPIHIIDFEGTQSSGILEYGVVTLHHNTIVQTQTRLCQATGMIRERDVYQHGITTNLTEKEMPFSQEWPFFSNLRLTGPLGAHHAQTENGLLKNVWPYPKTSPDFLNINPFCTSWGPWIDTCQLFKTIYPQLESYKLIDLIKVFQLTDPLIEVSRKYCPATRMKYHCALYDALASAVLLLYLTNLIDFKNISIEWLLINSASQDKRADMEQILL